MTETTLHTTCCIAGGGPAGMMVGFLLARAGIDVVVLEKHKDFFRDFRGDTIHPSTFELMHELGLLEEFLQLPHQEVTEIGAHFSNQFFRMADFSHLNVAKPALGFMPQWEFLNFLRQKAERYKRFHLLLEADAQKLVREDGKVVGVEAETAEGTKTIYAKLVIAADGRRSLLREEAQLKVINYGVPIDVLWFKLSRQSADSKSAFGFFNGGKLMVLLNRNEYWQCGYVIPKGDFDSIRQKDLASFRQELAVAVPFLKERTEELTDWEQIKLLNVAVDRLEKWYCEGLVCIGDAAHAMSPVGGVGINLALQDAVAAANILYPVLKENKNPGTEALEQIQKRREPPTKSTQRLQLIIQNNFLSRRLNEDKNMPPPLMLRLFNRFKILRRIPARLIGIGMRAEHIQTPEIT